MLFWVKTQSQHIAKKSNHGTNRKAKKAVRQDTKKKQRKEEHIILMTLLMPMYLKLLVPYGCHPFQQQSYAIFPEM